MNVVNEMKQKIDKIEEGMEEIKILFPAEYAIQTQKFNRTKIKIRIFTINALT